MEALYTWAFRYVGSTRPAGLMRIGLALILWYRFSLGTQYTLYTENPVLGVIFQLSILCMLAGWQAQISTFVAAVCALTTYYVYWATYGVTAWNHHHTYFVGMATLLLSMAPCGRSYSVDRLLAVIKAKREGTSEPKEEGNLFAIRLMALQMACMYFFAFWDKTIIANTNSIYVNFLNGTRLEQLLATFYFGSNFSIPAWASYAAGAAALTVAGLELVLPLLLFERFQKWWLIIPGLGLHFTFYVMLYLQTYSLSCMLLYLAIINANKTHAFLDIVLPPKEPGGPTDAESLTEALRLKEA